MSKDDGKQVDNVMPVKGPIALYIEELRRAFTEARASNGDFKSVRAIRDNYDSLNKLLHGYNFSDTQKIPNQYFSNKKYQDTKTGVTQYIEDLDKESTDFSPGEQQKAQDTLQLLEKALISFDIKNNLQVEPLKTLEESKVSDIAKEETPKLANIPTAFSKAMKDLKTLQVSPTPTDSDDEKAESTQAKKQ